MGDLPALLRSFAEQQGWGSAHLDETIHEAAQGHIDKQRNIQERSAAILKGASP